MNELMKNLDALNRKERFFVFTQATGNHDFRLGADFLAKLSVAVDIEVAADAKAYIDYHIDWLHAAVYIARNPLLASPYENGPLLKPGELRAGGKPPRVSTGNQEDLDLLIAFARGETTYIVMVEAKGETGWTNRQLDSKAKRLGEVFGFGAVSENADIRPVFCLWSPIQSAALKPDIWPEWMVRPGDAARSSADIAWMSLAVPRGRKKVTGVDKKGVNSEKRSHWRLQELKDREALTE